MVARSPTDLYLKSAAGHREFDVCNNVEDRRTLEGAQLVQEPVRRYGAMYVLGFGRRPGSPSAKDKWNASVLSYNSVYDLQTR